VVSVPGGCTATVGNNSIPENRPRRRKAAGNDGAWKRTAELSLLQVEQEAKDRPVWRRWRSPCRSAHTNGGRGPSTGRSHSASLVWVALRDGKELSHELSHALGQPVMFAVGPRLPQLDKGATRHLRPVNHDPLRASRYAINVITQGAW